MVSLFPQAIAAYFLYLSAQAENSYSLLLQRNKYNNHKIEICKPLE